VDPGSENEDGLPDEAVFVRKRVSMESTCRRLPRFHRRVRYFPEDEWL